MAGEEIARAQQAMLHVGTLDGLDLVSADDNTTPRLVIRGLQDMTPDDLVTISSHFGPLGPVPAGLHLSVLHCREMRGFQKCIQNRRKPSCLN